MKGKKGRRTQGPLGSGGRWAARWTLQQRLEIIHERPLRLDGLGARKWVILEGVPVSQLCSNRELSVCGMDQDQPVPGVALY